MTSLKQGYVAGRGELLLLQECLVMGLQVPYADDTQVSPVKLD